MSWQRNAMLVGNNATLEACWVGAGCGAVHWEQYYASDALRMYIYIYIYIYIFIHTFFLLSLLLLLVLLLLLLLLVLFFEMFS